MNSWKKSWTCNILIRLVRMRQDRDNTRGIREKLPACTGDKQQSSRASTYGVLVCQCLVQPPARGTELICPSAAAAAATTQTCVPAAQTIEGTACEAASAATAAAAAPHAHARNVRGHDPTHAHAPTTAAPNPTRCSTAARRPPALSLTQHWGGSRKGPRGVGNDPWPLPHPLLVTLGRRW